MTAWTSKDYVLSFFFLLCFCFCFVFNYIKYKLRILFKKKYLDFFKNLIVLYYALCAGQSCCPIIPPVL